MRKFEPGLTQAEQRDIAFHYISHTLLSAEPKLQPSWVRIADQHKNSIFFNVGCSCMIKEHDILVCVEFDKNLQTAIASFYNELSCHIDTADAWLEAYDNREKKLGHSNFTRWDDLMIWVSTQWRKIPILWKRFKMSTKLMFTGYAEWQMATIFKNSQHINDLIFALWWAKDMVEREGVEEDS